MPGNASGRWERGVLLPRLHPGVVFKERLLWLFVIVILGIAALHYRAEASTQLEKRLDELMQLVYLQKEVLLSQKEIVKTAETAVNVAAQGRLDCAESLEALQKHQNMIEHGLGIDGLSRRH